MLLINPVTGGEVEAFTDEAVRHLTSNGFTPKLEKKAEQPKKTTKKRTTKRKEQ